MFRRRLFLRYLAVTATFLPLQAMRRLATKDEPRPENGAFFMFRNVETIASIGAIVDCQVDMAIPNQLCLELRGMSLQQLLQGIEGQKIQRLVQEDFREGRVVQCDGFLLSVVEAAVYRAIFLAA